MAKIKLYTSTKKSFKLLGLSTPFVIAGIWMVSREDNSGMDYFMGWVGIIFFGLGMFIGIKQLFDKNVQIIIDENGIWDKSLKSGMIDWKYVKGAYPFDIYDSKFVSLVLDKEYESKIFQYKWATKMSHKEGAQKINLNLAHVKADEKRIAEIINKCAEKEISERKKYLKNVAQQRTELKTIVDKGKKQ